MESQFPDYARLENLSLIEEYFSRYQKGEGNIDSSWLRFFEGVDFAGREKSAGFDPSFRIYSLIEAYRCYGHLQASFNPLHNETQKIRELQLATLGFSDSELDQLFPSLGLLQEKKAPLRKIIQTLSSLYCGTIGFEYKHLNDPVLEQWIQQQIESRFVRKQSIEEKRFLLEALTRAEFFETFLHTKYVGQKRFSLEGEETLIPILLEMIEEGSRIGLEELIFGMAHRGRLNVLVNILGKSYSVLFSEFEDLLDSIEGSGDVKYHKGFSSEILSRENKKMTLHLAANPSHLESVDPVVLGQARARQKGRGEDSVTAVLIHGDAALAGQGVVYESLQLMNLPGYSIGGALHIVLNNQIGFTTLPQEGRSTHYCTDLAKTFQAPVFHLNAEDPEGAVFAAKLALGIRKKFHRDVFLDLNGYRKYGHNEGDEPSFTQPLQQHLIRQKKSIREIYCQNLLKQGVIEKELVEEIESKFKTTLASALSSAQAADRAFEPRELLGHHWEEYASERNGSLLDAVSTRVEEAKLRLILKKTSEIPEGFHLHPKLQKMLRERTTSERLDWNTAEWLALGSLLLEGISIRFTGQDVQRGTFSQRHMVWVDQENEARFSPLAHLQENLQSPKQDLFEIVNSPLSEYATLGFEVGYSWAAPKDLVIWEAQFGDFFNGAQIIIDQYISSAEQKWNRTSSIVLLLPHGFEGQGPEHSSGRIERFLQLCAQENMLVVNASTPAQYFHLLRRQALRKQRKPLIVFTPKSLLRAPACTSKLIECVEREFEEILDDPIPPKKRNRMIFCSGHIFYDLLEERTKTKNEETVLIRIEQLYPFHQEKMKKILARYEEVSEVRFVQEEPQNMGAWNFLRPQLEEILPAKVSLKYVGREPSASPATGSHHKHERELKQLLREAFL